MTTRETLIARLEAAYGDEGNAPLIHEAIHALRQQQGQREPVANLGAVCGKIMPSKDQRLGGPRKVCMKPAGHEKECGEWKGMNQWSHGHINEPQEKIKRVRELLQVMIASSEVFVNEADDNVITGYKIKTGALHTLIGLLSLYIPVNLPLAATSPPAPQARELPRQETDVEDEAFRLRQRLQDVRMYLLDESFKRDRKDIVLEEAYQMTQRPFGWRYERSANRAIRPAAGMVPVEPLRILLNGWEVKIQCVNGLFPTTWGQISYEDIVEWSGRNPNGIYTVVYSMPHGSDKRDGSLTKGQSVQIENHMRFSVADTSNA